MKRICIALLVLTFAALCLAASPRQHRSWRAVADRPRGAAAIPENALLLWLQFNDNQNLNYTDSSIYTHSVTSTASMVSNGVLRFDGSSYLSAVPASTLALTTQLTFATWAYYTNTLTTVAHNFISKKTSGGTDGPMTYFDNSHKVYAFLYGVTPVNVASTTDVRRAVWTHWVTTYSGTNIALYCNGALETNAACSGTLSTNNVGATVGFYNGNKMPANTLLDDVRIYGRCLSAAEVQTLYTTTTETRPNP